MYVAVTALIAGQGLLFGSVTVLEYGARIVWAGFFLFVVAYEEPALGEQFGDAVQALPGEREAMVTAHYPMARVGGKKAFGIVGCWPAEAVPARPAQIPCSGHVPHRRAHQGRRRSIRRRRRPACAAPRRPGDPGRHPRPCCSFQSYHRVSNWPRLSLGIVFIMALQPPLGKRLRRRFMSPHALAEVMTKRFGDPIGRIPG